MIAAVVGPAAVLALLAQSPATSPQPGQQITVHDGDTVVVDGGAHIRVVRRIGAQVRAVYSADDLRVILLLDEDDAGTGATIDGFVDERVVFDHIAGNWPLANQWDGRTVVEQYMAIDRSSRIIGYGFATPNGFIRLVPSIPFRTETFQDTQAATVLTYRGASGGPAPRGLAFDAAEKQTIAELGRGRGFGAPVAAGVVTGTPTVSGVVAGGLQPVRVGGNIVAPTKLVDAKPVYPPDAQAARIQGVVIIEAVIGPDGTVQDAKVLRSIPLLDDAALAAVKQWRFTQTLLNGQPVPVIMTVTVNFALRN